jgi:acyl-CoA reductase-like NAD-dependent aldehyde dehydrogenase
MSGARAQDLDGKPFVPLLIGGKAVETEAWAAVFDPAAPHQTVGHAALASAAQARAAVDAAHGLRR